jgi:quercetin dioxygenase-like cupin family protein
MHETDMPTALRNVRYQGQSGKHVLALSFSGFDPTRTLVGTARIANR